MSGTVVIPGSEDAMANKLSDKDRVLAIVSSAAAFRAVLSGISEIRNGGLQQDTEHVLNGARHSLSLFRQIPTGFHDCVPDTRDVRVKRALP